MSSAANQTRSRRLYACVPNAPIKGAATPTALLGAISRRAFLRGSALVMAAATGGELLAADKPALRFGVFTDVHYADIPTTGKRHYRDSLAKVRDSVTRFNAAKTDFVIELGDFIDAAPAAEGELENLRTINAAYAQFAGERHYVLGNHCLWSLTKPQFLETCERQQAHYSFDKAGFHFVVLDACYRSDGVAYGAKNNKWSDANIPAAEQAWLRGDLQSAKQPAIVFIHHRLDVATTYAIKSAGAVRKILEASGQVLTVFQGHNHLNDHREINGIHYCTLTALVEGTASASGLVDVHTNGTIIVNGYQRQKNHTLRRAG